VAKPLSEPPSARAARYRLEVPGLERSAGATDGPDVVQVAGPQAGARAAAWEIARSVGIGWRARLARRLSGGRISARPGGGRLAMPGGRTAEAIYDALMLPVFRERIAWSAVDVSFVDERAVPPDDPESNYALARHWLVDRLGAPAGRLHRMPADAIDAEAAANAYARELERPLDLVVLGLGEDGHFASLFPGSALLEERERRVAVVRDSPKPPPVRLTITPRVLAEARRVLVVVLGAAKAGSVARAFEPSAPVGAWPARLLRDATWIVDAGD
jgi:6-phosphogluconolactonase